jgi:hypothetical protein
MPIGPSIAIRARLSASGAAAERRLTAAGGQGASVRARRAERGEREDRDHDRVADLRSLARRQQHLPRRGQCGSSHVAWRGRDTHEGS